MVGTWGALERQYLHHWLDWSTLARTWEVLEYHLLRHTCAPLPQYLRTIERPNSRKHLILHTSVSLTLLGSKQDQIQPDSKMHLTAQCGNWIFSFCLIASLFVFTSRFANFVQGKWSNHDSKNCSEIRTVMWSVIWLWKSQFTILIFFTPLYCTSWLQNISKSWIPHTTSKEDQIQPVSKMHTTAHLMTNCCTALYPITNPWSIFKKSQNAGSVTHQFTQSSSSSTFNEHRFLFLCHVTQVPVIVTFFNLIITIFLERFTMSLDFCSRFVYYSSTAVCIYLPKISTKFTEGFRLKNRATNVENNMLPWYTKTRALCVFVFTPSLPRNNDTSPLIDPRFSLFPIWPAHGTFLRTMPSFSINFLYFCLTLREYGIWNWRKW